MLRIYGSARSRGVRTLWIAGELGLQYEHLDYAPRSPATRTPEYLALNPNGRVPTIDDDGFVLSESMAINLYLAKKHGKLYPADAKHEALAWQWSFWEVDRLDRQQRRRRCQVHLGGDRGCARRAGVGTGQVDLARRPRVQHCGPERGVGHGARAGVRSRQMAEGACVAA